MSQTVPVGMALEIDEQMAGVRDVRWAMLRLEDMLLTRCVEGTLTDAEGVVLRAIRAWASYRVLSAR